MIGLLLGRSLTKMRHANPNAVHILVVCSWNCTGDTVHREMNATADLCQSETLSEVEAVAARHTNKGWVFRPFLEPPAFRRSPMPLTLFQTDMHDDHPGPPAMCGEFLILSVLSATTRSCFRLSVSMQGPAESISFAVSDNRRTRLTFSGTSTIITMEASTWTSRLQCASHSPRCRLAWRRSGT